MRIWSWPADSLEPSQTARICTLARLYIGDKGLSFSVQEGVIYLA